MPMNQVFEADFVPGFKPQSSYALQPRVAAAATLGSMTQPRCG